MTKLSKLLPIFYTITVILIFIISWTIGPHVKISSQIEIYKTLLTIGAIVFAIMGAWLSILKIEISNGVKNAETNEEGDFYVKKARKLISPMSASALIIIGALIFIFTYYSFKDIQVLHNYTEWYRRASFLILSFLTTWQLSALFGVMFSGIEFLLEISRENKDLQGDRNR